MAEDAGFLADMDRVAAAFDNYLHAKPWFQDHYPDEKIKVAYFSAEFGLHESLPIYSGGLGILAGDHLKSVSELGVPLIGVGLAYQQGYFRQYLNADGWQQERYPENDFFTMPLDLQVDAKGVPVKVGVEYPGRMVYAEIGESPLVAHLSYCSTAMYRRTAWKIGRSPPNSTAATRTCAFDRN